MGGQTRLATITAVSPASDNQKLDTASEAAVSDPCGFESLGISEPTALEQDEQGVWSGTTNRIWWWQTWVGVTVGGWYRLP